MKSRSKREFTPRVHEALEDLEPDLLLQAVARRYGHDFRHYSPTSLKRHIQRSMEAERVPTISALQDRLLHDMDCFRRFLAVLPVNVTSMFRDPPFYRMLRDLVVPLLRTYPRVQVWHAGCSTGEEAYSLAIILQETGLHDRCRIYATDISEALIERARSGVLDRRSVAASADNYRESGGLREFSSYYRLRSGEVVLDDSLRRNILFSCHSLATDGSFNEFQLVLCRNVMIYFDQDLRQRVHSLIYDSLARFGILGLGLQESIRLSRFSKRYEAVHAPTRLYRKIA